MITIDTDLSYCNYVLSKIHRNDRELLQHDVTDTDVRMYHNALLGKLSNARGKEKITIYSTNIYSRPPYNAVNTLRVIKNLSYTRKILV